MVIDAVRSYVQLAAGLTGALGEATAQRATSAARGLAEAVGSAPGSSGGGLGALGSLSDQLPAQVAGQLATLQVIARELGDVNRNLDLVATVVRTEIESALLRLGVASAADVVTLRKAVDRLERRVRALEAERAHTPPQDGAGAADPATGRPGLEGS